MGRGDNLPQPRPNSCSITHLSHLDKLDEDFSSELWGGAAEHHQLHPLGDAIAQGNGPLHGGVLLHAAVHQVILIIGELGEKKHIRIAALVLWEIQGACRLCSDGSECYGTEELLALSYMSSTWLTKMVGRKSYSTHSMVSLHQKSLGISGCVPVYPTHQLSQILYLGRY